MSQFNPYLEALIHHHEEYERFPAFFEVQADLDDATFWRLLRVLVTKQTVFQPHQEIIRRMLTAERCNTASRLEAWTQADFDWIKRRARYKKPVKVYRGGATRFGLTGFNWTTSYDRARMYAECTGMPKGIITIGHVDPMQVMLPISESKDFFVFPDHVAILKHDEVYDIDPLLIRESQLRAAAGLKGVSFVGSMTPGEALRSMIETGKRDKDKALETLAKSRVYLEGLGFKARIETIDQIVKDISDAVRSAE